MRFIDNLCPPALLYLIYVVIHTGLDLSLGRFATAAIKVVMGVAGTVILDALCGVDLGIVSWAIVATPFIMVALASSISLGLGLDRMMSNAIRDNFSNPITADNTKNRDIYVTQEKNQNALPVSTDYVQ
jgi:hypothetical protein